MEDNMLIIHMTAGELAEYLEKRIEQKVEAACNKAIYNIGRQQKRDKLISFNALVREKTVGARIRIKRLIAQGHIKQTDDGKIIYSSVLNYLENAKEKKATE
ncbi:MAG: hypothetical protein M0R21_12450 [Lentimicrobiaceae bacterium]|jgi:hypothetical protein|nr:hypothetical protein [Lentimicrobiaceae bacterium]